MSDFKNHSVATEKSEAEASSQDEAGSSSSAPKQESGGRSSFWSRATRLWRMTGASTLRKDLADALMTEENGGEPTFLPEERAWMTKLLDVGAETLNFVVPGANLAKLIIVKGMEMKGMRPS